MWLSKTALTTVLLSLAQTPRAVTHFGCWSDAGAKFNENCITALTALVTSWTYLEKTDYATVPETLVSHTYGGCTAELKTRYGNSVPVKALLSSFDILVSRCQNGYYYYDDGWLNANIRGHANRKRDTTMASDSAIDLSSSSLVQWETPESPEPLPLAVGPLSNIDTSLDESGESMLEILQSALRPGYLSNHGKLAVLSFPCTAPLLSLR